MKIYKIIKNTTVEGPGNRFCIWVQGCSRHCRGCFAQETWDFSAGEYYDVNVLFDMIKSQNGIEGVTFLGGEPFEQINDVLELSKLIKSINLSIVCFTGFKIEELKQKNDNNINKLLTMIDLLIDGGFEKEKFDLSRPWVGSSNQRYIFLSNRYNAEHIKKYKNKIEMRIDSNGKILINGMGDFEELKRNFSLQQPENIVK